MRFIEASPSDPGTANVELKASPEEVSGDPAVPGHPQADHAVRLPGSLGEALKALEASDELRSAAGD